MLKVGNSNLVLFSALSPLLHGQVGQTVIRYFWQEEKGLEENKWPKTYDTQAQHTHIQTIHKYIRTYTHKHTHTFEHIITNTKTPTPQKAHICPSGRQPRKQENKT